MENSFSLLYPNLYYLVSSIIRNVNKEDKDVLQWYTHKFDSRIQHMRSLDSKILKQLENDAIIINSTKNGLEKLDESETQQKQGKHFGTLSNKTKDSMHILAFKNAMMRYTKYIK